MSRDLRRLLLLLGLLTVAALGPLGCGSALTPGVRSDRWFQKTAGDDAVRRRAEKDPFPTAAQVGLPSVPPR